MVRRQDALSLDESIVLDAGTGAQIGFIVTEAGQVFMETFASAQPQSRLWVMAADETTATLAIDHFRPSELAEQHAGVLITADWIIGGREKGLVRLSIEQPDAWETLLESDGFVLLQSAADGYVYYVITEAPSESERHYRVERVALSGGGDPEVLRRTDFPPQSVVTRDGTMYWAEDGKLLRKELGAVPR